MSITARIITSLLITVFLGAGIGYGLTVYSSTFSISPTPDIVGDVEFTQSVFVTFKESVSDNNYREQITISPNRAVFAKWSEDRKRLELTPREYWKPQTNYTISLPPSVSSKLTQIEAMTFSFQTSPYPEISSITPTDGTKDILLDIEDPLIVDFESSTQDFFVDFALSPEVDVEYQNDPEKLQFKILPKQAIQNGETYQLTVRARYKDAPESEYHEIASSSFSTLPPPPEDWSDDLIERADQAKRFTRPQITDGKYIDINLTSQVLTMFENGQAIDSFIVSSGKSGMDTPKGEHQIYNKHSRPWSKKYSLYMPFWMAITADGKYGLHELPEWPGGYKEGQNHLGIPVSHGCVRLGVGPAERLYNWADIGTPVIVY